MDADASTPLLYALRNDLRLNGPRFGCGLAQCGACTVLADGTPIRSCVTPLSAVTETEITTVEGLGDRDAPHPVQAAFIAEQAAQCGYCSSGMIMSAAALLGAQSESHGAADSPGTRRQSVPLRNAHENSPRGAPRRGNIGMSAGIEVTRRVFLQSVSALAICVSVPRLAFSQGAMPRSLEANPNLDTWLRINADATVSIWTGKAELGQGIRTALAQIAAEELDVAFERIRIEAVDTARSPSEGRTTGSVSIERSGAAIRMASAEARQLLLHNAAARLNIPAERLSVNDGQVLADGRDAELSYRELLSDAAFDTRATASVAPKHPDQHRIVGTAQERIDLPAKFFGEPAYVHDVRLPACCTPESCGPRWTAPDWPRWKRKRSAEWTVWSPWCGTVPSLPW